MDKIFIKDLQVYGYHGVNKEEKEMGQRFLISLELYMDLSMAGQSDDLNKTVNYAEICERVEAKFKEEKFDLIEAAAENVATFVLNTFNLVNGVKVNIKKPWAPIGKPLDYAGVEITRFWHTTYIGIGSNMGSREENINKSIEKISEINGNGNIKISKMYETKPVGYTQQDDFLNCVIEMKTLLSPMNLIDELLKIEKELKRERTLRWGPRTIDLDVLLYDEEILSSEKLVVPHPRMQERLFVLAPLCDLVPYKLHPILRTRIIELKENLDKKEKDAVKLFN
ncbi:dihydroneopterin aldolase / 2-amino-4-hydroxy-6-hydroxymethyldihydropteridine diphosphokinase [Clostridium acidisoli DSM 12555]|uniref:Bifunctional folate synthesis protein n=1 Tax=Clostridium acidisoli DSM 12555 TaxID=1121291 RepID=A0A1W1X7N9_9CLOT|nr:2-amino-4-hydroxy-6-hydroxymethyldihydropteridine diphosphokinase [Clostridium acidisoli]SMC19955.1 dihydroneopterin aldolase / 2-amino-4-hydroxy-6-hydroxymethyldihydropteridine diphosphokinase [Clostridium acidisoli DSM 12555]